MLVPATPPDEALRLATLHSLDVLDTPSEERFDRLTRIARRLFDVPMALVTLIDARRQWFKSSAGLDATETSRDLSFCGHAILGSEVLVVNDARLDARFSDNPYVTGHPYVRFYAGCPLTVRGSKLGTLCLIDHEPRRFDDKEQALLRDLAAMAEEELGAVQLASMDALTSLSNRRGFEALAAHALAVCTRTGRSATLLYMDLDGLKQINDRYGHGEGDRALRRFAGILVETFRDSDVVARLGGDEFAALFTGAGADGASAALERLSSRIDEHNRAKQSAYALRCSIGLVSCDGDRHADLPALLAEADSRMYEEKRRHKTASL